MSDIISMAREARLGAVLCHNSIDGDRVWIEGADWHDELERFASLIRADEREQNAKLAEETVCDTHLPTGVKIYGSRVAAAIRARNES